MLASLDNSFWALVALLIFIAILFYYKVPSMLTRSLDGRAKRISDELDEARRLREEAQQVLAEYQRKHSEAEKEVESIIAAAKREADAMTQEARKKMEDYVERRNKLAEQKIVQAEEGATQAVRSAVVDLAVEAAGKIIAKELDTKKADALFRTSLDNIKNQLN